MATDFPFWVGKIFTGIVSIVSIMSIAYCENISNLKFQITPAYLSLIENL